MRRCYVNNTFKQVPSPSVLETEMKHIPDRSCKLLPNFSGLYLITEKMHDSKFKILDPVRHSSKVVHADRLKHVGVPLPPNIQPPTYFHLYQ